MEHQNLKNRKNRQFVDEQSQDYTRQTVFESLNFKTGNHSNENSKISFFTENIFMIILSVRTLSVCFNLIWDCDEVYNYWEPLHFVLFGNGFQTWEYSPEYSLRSYLYIYLHALPIWPFKWIVSSKITLFYMLRFFLALMASKIETYLFHNLLEVTKESKNYSKVAYFYIILSLSNAGMFLSVTSFLPSTFSMYLVMLAYGAWLKKNNSRLAIFSIGLAVLLGWPFAAILGVPIAIDMCFSTMMQSFLKKLFYFLKWTIIFGILITVPLIAFDSYLFGKTVFAPFNIVMYNVFPSNPNQGPDLYGKEPLSYYLLNCILNFNILFPLIWITLFALYGAEYVYEDTEKRRVNSKLNKSFKIILFAMYLWFLVFFTRPHKEERFLYPIYPLFLISASATLNFIHLGLKKCFKDSKIKSLVNQLPYLILIFHAIISLMRVIALYMNFSSSIHIYEILNQPETKFRNPILEHKENINVCVEKEWYRFPSNFFIPENLDENVKHQNWRFRFLESHFKGQLPGNYNEHLNIPYSTRHVDKLFNDENKEVRDRYVKIQQCDYFIDTDSLREDKEIVELRLDGVKSKWKTLAKLPFIDMSSASNRFLRAFYVPYLYETKVRITFFKLRIKTQ